MDITWAVRRRVDVNMPREPMIPLSAVNALLNNQNAFNAQLIDKLGLHLEKAALAYERALNPPIDTGPDVPMSYTGLNEEAEDLYHQIESGQITPDQITGNMRKLLGDAEMSIDLS